MLAQPMANLSAVKGEQALGPLVARDHGAHQILAVREARENHSGDMGENEPESDLGDEHVRLLHRLAGILSEHPGKRARLMFPAINHKTGYHRRCKEEKKEITMAPPPGLCPRWRSARNRMRSRI